MNSEHVEKQEYVQIGIDIKKLESLFNQGLLCVADIHCLNNDTKKCIWELCLTACSKRMDCHLTHAECHADCGCLTQVNLKQSPADGCNRNRS